MRLTADERERIREARSGARLRLVSDDGELRTARVEGYREKYGIRPGPRQSPPPEPKAPIGPGAGVFSGRQLEVIRLLALGMRDRQIAAFLAISINTVHSLTRRAHEKAGVHTSAQLVAVAYRHGVLW